MGLLALEIIMFYSYIVPHVEMMVNAAIMDGLRRAIITWPNMNSSATSTTDYVAPYAAYLIDQRAMSIALEDSFLMMRIQAQGTVTSIATLSWFLCAVTWCFAAKETDDETRPHPLPQPTRSRSESCDAISQEETVSSLNEVVATFSRHILLPPRDDSRHRYTM
jgi:hypothetical protein